MDSKCSCAGEQGTSSAISTVDLQQLAHFQKTAQNTLASTPIVQATSLSGTGLQDSGQLHVTSDGGLLVSTGYASGNEGYVVLTGSIGALPYEIHLSFKLEIREVTVTMELKKPIPLGPFTWKFQLFGAALGSNGGIQSATTVVAVDLNLGALNAGPHVDLLCALKCGGLTILGILIKCLPALITGGPPAFIACVTALAGAGAAGIAACIAKDCVKN